MYREHCYEFAQVFGSLHVGLFSEQNLEATQWCFVLECEFETTDRVACWDFDDEIFRIPTNIATIQRIKEAVMASVLPYMWESLHQKVSFWRFLEFLTRFSEIRGRIKEK